MKNAQGFDDQVYTTKLESLVDWAKESGIGGVVNWCRSFSLFQYPFVTACCGMEYMAAAAPHHDIDRFGAAVPRFSPRQADVLWVVGTINHKNAPVLRRIYEQMTEPKWVVSFGACASTGGFYDNYATVPGIDHIIPVDVYIPGCPPRPEAVMDAILSLQDQVRHEPDRLTSEEDLVPLDARVGAPSASTEAGW